MATLASTVSATFSASRAAAIANAPGVLEQHRIDVSESWPNGSGASQTAQVYSVKKTETAAAGTSYELDNLTQLDVDGATVRSSVSFSKVKRIVIKNTSTTGKLTIGGGSTGAGAADAFAGAGYPLVADNDLLDLPAGGVFVWSAPSGVAVSNGATDILRILAVTADQTYEMLITGD